MAIKRRNRQKPRSAAAGLNEDIILEIVKRLPLKSAVQCSVLNKNFFNRISNQPDLLPHYSAIFQSYGDKPTLYTSIWESIRSTKTVRQLRRSVALNTPLHIISSCNGLFFLRVVYSTGDSLFYVFNPATARILSVDCMIMAHNDVGLAAPDDSVFKLVTLDVGTLLHFTVYDRSVPHHMRIKSKASCEYNRRFKPMTRGYNRSVYAHGSMYWLADYGRITIAFNVESLEVRVIDGPAESNEERNYWFGFADDAVQFVYSLGSEIVMCRHDHVRGEWLVKHRVRNDNHNEDDDEPLFFDGQRLLFMLRKNVEGGGDVYMYDLFRDSWEKRESCEKDSKPKLFWYSSTLVTNSRAYLKENDHFGFWENEFTRKALLGLQKLLMPAETPIHVPPPPPPSQEDVMKARPKSRRRRRNEEAVDNINHGRPKRITTRPHKFKDFS